MRTLTRAEFAQLSPMQRAVRSHQVRAVVGRYQAQHHARYHADESREVLARAVAVHAAGDQLRDQRGRFARGAS